MPAAISIIVPCYNEEATVGALLEGILRQTYPRPDMEVIIADGRSHDRTREAVAAFQQNHPDLKIQILDNAKRIIPAGLNLAGAAACGEFLIRLDAHSIPVAGYVERCVNDLEAGKGSVVGGLWVIQPGAGGFIAESIAQAASHPLGVGDAMYRLQAAEGPVDTVPFGAFHRSLFEQLGGFDETLLTNEDYEFNTRVRRGGGVVWLDPGIRSSYTARPNLLELGRQYWRYGFWKYRMLQRHPGSLRWRQALPPLFVASLMVLGVASIFTPLAAYALLAEAAIYLAVLLIAGIQAAMHRGRAPLALGLLLAISTMHLCWGAGFLWSIVSAPWSRNG